MYSRYREKWKHEDDLAIKRTNLSFIVVGFCYAAIGYLIKESLPSGLLSMKPEIWAVSAFVALGGCVATYGAFCGVKAACDAQKELKQQWAHVKRRELREGGSHLLGCHEEEVLHVFDDLSNAGHKSIRYLSRVPFVSLVLVFISCVVGLCWRLSIC